MVHPSGEATKSTVSQRISRVPRKYRFYILSSDYAITINYEDVFIAHIF